MKKIKIITLVLTTISLIMLYSCGKDDDPDFPQSKWQTVTINGKDFFNCTEAVIHLSSSYEEKKIYDREDGHYVEIDGVSFRILMYDEQSIEAKGTASIYFSIPATAFKSGNIINGDIIDIGVSTATNGKMWHCDANDRKIILQGGTATLVGLSDGKATVKFDNFKAKLGSENVSINGYATCEKF
ncbi:MAG: hypothetical protein HUK14_01570 [Muribaculaceae bacterium]|nr:hypothetical protein [Muribaculaceae bacterium]